jgi:hypothetical protein
MPLSVVLYVLYFYSSLFTNMLAASIDLSSSCVDCLQFAIETSSREMEEEMIYVRDDISVRSTAVTSIM